jgi:hypothetical protein
MVADLESLIPSTCLAIGFVLLVKTILRNQNPQRRAAAKAREAAAEAADSRIMHEQRPLSELKSKTELAKSAKAKRLEQQAKASAAAAPAQDSAE